MSFVHYNKKKKKAVAWEAMHFEMEVYFRWDRLVRR